MASFYAGEKRVLNYVLDFLPFEDVLSCSLVSKEWFRACGELGPPKLRWVDGAPCALASLFYKLYHAIMRECDLRKNGEEKRANGYFLRSGGKRSFSIKQYYHPLGKPFWDTLQNHERGSKVCRVASGWRTTMDYIRQIIAVPGTRVDVTYLHEILQDFVPREYGVLRGTWYFDISLLNCFQMSLSANVCQSCLEINPDQLDPICFRCLRACGRPDWRVCKICLDVLERQREIRRYHEMMNALDTRHIEWVWGTCSYMNPDCESYSHAGQGCDCPCHRESDDEGGDSMSEDDEVYGF